MLLQDQTQTRSELSEDTRTHSLTDWLCKHGNANVILQFEFHQTKKRHRGTGWTSALLCSSQAEADGIGCRVSMSFSTIERFSTEWWSQITTRTPLKVYLVGWWGFSRFWFHFPKGWSWCVNFDYEYAESMPVRTYKKDHNKQRTRCFVRLAVALQQSVWSSTIRRNVQKMKK